MDEYTANPYETEKEANRVLKKMQADKNVETAKAAEGKAAVENARAQLREMGYLKDEPKKTIGPRDVGLEPKEFRTPPKGSITKSDLKPSGGGMGGLPMDKMDKMKKMNYKAGGTVKSASSRADGCCIRGKTRA